VRPRIDQQKKKKGGGKMTDNEILALNEAERTPCECWTRVMGYFRPYSHFNKGKTSEFDERQWFTEAKCSCELKQVA
jgi:anaerobic ribonucleoside-triphosphate reductase